MKAASRLFVVALALAVSVSAALAAADVRAMPDRQARPGAAPLVHVWGNAANGAFGVGNANGEAYTWSFAPNVNVTVTDDGLLSGIVANDKYIVEDVTFTLLNGSTREFVTATLDVGGTTDTVVIDIVAPADPISNTPQGNLKVNVNISIANGLLFAYLQQTATGSWTHGLSYGTPGLVANTSICTQAFENSGHSGSGTTAYSPFVQKGLNFLFSTSVVVDIAGHALANFHNHIPPVNCPSGQCAVDPTGPLSIFYEGYSNGFAAAAVEASVNPGAVITVGPPGILGLTYKQWVEEWTDAAAYGQRDNNLQNSGQGGWYYQYSGFPFGTDDVSIDSWNYFGLLGADTAFGSTYNPKIKDNIDTSLVNRQDGVAGNFFGRFGYVSKTPIGDSPGTATTCAGLAGMALEELPGNKTAGTPNYPASGNPLAPANLDSFVEKRDAALAMLGRTWGMNLAPSFLRGNLGNHYVMATCCRGLRETQGGDPNNHILNNDGTFGGAIGPFNWETNIPLLGDNITRGYWPWLVSTQQANGRWQTATSPNEYDVNFDTCTALFCLNTTLFGCCGDGVVVSPEQCDEGAGCGLEVSGNGCDANCQFEIVQCDPDPRTQGYWHRQCLGTGEINPGRSDRGPTEPNDPDFVSTAQPCADMKLEDLGFYGLSTCDAMDADPQSDPCERALKQCTATILNTCSDRLQNACEVDLSVAGCSSTNVGDLINEVATLIQNGQCQQAADCCAAVNEGTALTSLVAPAPTEATELSVGGAEAASRIVDPGEAIEEARRTREFVDGISALSILEKRRESIQLVKGGGSGDGTRLYLVPERYFAKNGVSYDGTVYRIVVRGRTSESSLQKNGAFMAIRTGLGQDGKRFLVAKEYAVANRIPTEGTNYVVVPKGGSQDAGDIAPWSKPAGRR